MHRAVVLVLVALLVYATTTPIFNPTTTTTYFTSSATLVRESHGQSLWGILSDYVTSFHACEVLARQLSNVQHAAWAFIISYISVCRRNALNVIQQSSIIRLAGKYLLPQPAYEDRVCDEEHGACFWEISSTGLPAAFNPHTDTIFLLLATNTFSAIFSVFIFSLVLTPLRMAWQAIKRATGWATESTATQHTIQDNLVLAFLNLSEIATIIVASFTTMFVFIVGHAVLYATSRLELSSKAAKSSPPTHIPRVETAPKTSTPTYTQPDPLVVGLQRQVSRLQAEVEERNNLIDSISKDHARERHQLLGDNEILEGANAAQKAKLLETLKFHHSIGLDRPMYEVIKGLQDDIERLKRDLGLALERGSEREQELLQEINEREELYSAQKKSEGASQESRFLREKKKWFDVAQANLNANKAAQEESRLMKMRLEEHTSRACHRPEQCEWEGKLISEADDTSNDDHNVVSSLAYNRTNIPARRLSSNGLDLGHKVEDKSGVDSSALEAERKDEDTKYEGVQTPDALRLPEEEVKPLADPTSATPSHQHDEDDSMASQPELTIEASAGVVDDAEELEIGYDPADPLGLYAWKRKRMAAASSIPSSNETAPSTDGQPAASQLAIPNTPAPRAAGGAQNIPSEAKELVAGPSGVPSGKGLRTIMPLPKLFRPKKAAEPRKGPLPYVFGSEAPSLFGSPTSGAKIPLAIPSLFLPAPIKVDSDKGKQPEAPGAGSATSMLPKLPAIFGCGPTEASRLTKSPAIFGGAMSPIPEKEETPGARSVSAKDLSPDAQPAAAEPNEEPKSEHPAGQTEASEPNCSPKGSESGVASN